MLRTLYDEMIILVLKLILFLKKAVIGMTLTATSFVTSIVSVASTKSPKKETLQVRFPNLQLSF